MAQGICPTSRLLTKSPSSPSTDSSTLRFAPLPTCWHMTRMHWFLSFLPSGGSWPWPPVPTPLFSDNDWPHVSDLGHCKGNSGIFLCPGHHSTFNHCSTFKKKFLYFYVYLFVCICRGMDVPHLHRNSRTIRRICKDLWSNSGHEAWQQESPSTKPTCWPPHIFKRYAFAFWDYNHTISPFPCPPSKFSHLLNFLIRWNKNRNFTKHRGRVSSHKGWVPCCVRISLPFCRMNPSSECKDDQRPRLKILWRPRPQTHPYSHSIWSYLLLACWVKGSEVLLFKKV